jgi:RNA polymerase sigma-70 factor (ECF subfamily)
LKAKDERGLSALYDQYSHVLMGIIIRIVRNKGVAEEILQQTMLKVWGSIDQYDENKSTLFTWMSTIARNSAIDKRRLVSFQNNEKTEDIDNLVYTSKTVSSSSSGIDVDRLTGKLESKYKDVLDHVYLMGYTQAEAAEALDIPLGTVKTRLRQAIVILREELKQEKNLFLGMLVLLLILIIIL